MALVAVAIWLSVRWYEPASGKIGGERVTFFQSHGNWETLCDVLQNEPSSARCYLRLVDVYSPRPDFGAYVGFISASNGVESFELSLEPGSELASDGFALTRGSATLWSMPATYCRENKCTISGDGLIEMIALAETAEGFSVAFKDRKNRNWQRRLSAGDFTAAHQAYETAKEQYGLPAR